MPTRKTPFRPTLSVFDDPPPAVALSVILPCYKAAELARRSVMRLTHALAGRIPSYEIIVVDDGIGDCEPVMRDLPTGPGGRVHVITLPENRGKGGAVAAGMKSASGRVRVFTDVEIPYGTTPVMLIESMIRTRGFHMVIGDRTFPQSRYETDMPLGRKLASGVFSKITATMITGRFFDTQCGLKGFRGDIAEALFGLQTVERFAFDVELIYLAQTYGLEIKRIPVVLERKSKSSGKLVRDAAQRLVDVTRIKLHQLHSDYDSDTLRGLVARECTEAAAPFRTPVIAHAVLKVRA